MTKWLLFIIFCCVGCGEQYFYVDMNSTFVLDGSFSQDEQAEIVSALYDWEQVTQGIVNNKIIISDTPNLYGNEFNKIEKKTVSPRTTLDNIIFGRTNNDLNTFRIEIYLDSIKEKKVELKAVAAHELGHAFGLSHSNSGLMVAKIVDNFDKKLSCIDQDAINKFCNIHDCSGKTLKTNCE